MNVSNMFDASNMTNPFHMTVDSRKNISEPRTNQISDHHMRTIPKAQNDNAKKFVPSPELIVDSSQSSESKEKIVINNHRYIIPVS